jgi:hypothetical protein
VARRSLDDRLRAGAGRCLGDRERRYIVDAVAALAGQHSKPAAVVIVVRPRPAVCVDPDHDGDCDAPGQP